MKMDRRLVSIMVILLTGYILGCEAPEEEKKEETTGEEGELPKSDLARLENCYAHIDGDRVMISGSLINDWNSSVGTGDVQCRIWPTDEGRPVPFRGRSASMNISILPRGGEFPILHEFTLSSSWRLPRFDGVLVKIETIFRDWEMMIPFAYLAPSECSIGTGFHRGENWEFIVYAAFANNQSIGNQIVEYEPYFEYELRDGTIDSRSEILSASLRPSRVTSTGTRGGFQHRFQLWPVDLPVPRDTVVRLVAGVRSGGVDWNQTVVG